MKNVVIGLGLSVVIAAVLGGGAYFSYSNSEISLRNQIAATQKSNEAVFDTTWKILKQQANVADKYKDAFKDIYTSIMSERYSKGDGSLMKWITESNPQFDSRMYSQLMNSIEAQRATFLAQQKKLIDLKREHDNLRLMFPSSIFLRSRPSVEITIVTSSRTDDVFKAGQENDLTF